MLFQIISSLLFLGILYLSYRLKLALNKDPDIILQNKVIDLTSLLKISNDKITLLSQELKEYKRERLGLVAKWITPKEDESA